MCFNTEAKEMDDRFMKNLVKFDSYKALFLPNDSPREPNAAIDLQIDVHACVKPLRRLKLAAAF